MRTIRLFALASVLGIAAAPTALSLAPIVALAQSQPQPPTKQQLQTAVRAANPTIGQLRALRKLEPNVNNMTPEQLRGALQQIFSPGQLATIVQSLKAQGVSIPGHKS
jgi:ABC-type sugar transport system substrate-binding protein